MKIINIYFQINIIYKKMIFIDKCYPTINYYSESINTQIQSVTLYMAYGVHK